MSIRKSPKPSNHVCRDCGRTYKAAETLNRHRKNHIDSVQYVCTFCAASFKRKDLLDRHSQIHVGGRPSINRNRSLRACHRCSRLKTRCDNAIPCGPCSRGSHECTYKHLATRSRTDSSLAHSPSASARSSVNGSPTVSPAQLNTSAGERTSSHEAHVTALPQVDWTVSGGMVQPWMQEQGWQLYDGASIDHSVYAVEGGLEASHATHLMVPDRPTDSSLLQHSLEDSTLSPGSPQTETSGILFDSVFSTLWQRKHPVQAEVATNDPSYNNHPVPSSLLSNDLPQDLRSPRHLYDMHSTQQHTIQDLIAFSTSGYSTGTSQESGRTLYWQRLASAVENAFGLHGMAHVGSDVLDLLQELFLHYFPTSYMQKHAYSRTTSPPHLYLTMAAIGAAYAGPRAETFYNHLLHSLRPRIMQFAVESVLSDEATLLLIQSLVFLQAAMLNFSDQDALRSAPEMAAIIVVLSRRVHLFDNAKFMQAQLHLACEKNTVDYNARGGLATEVARLDMLVAKLHGTMPLLSDSEAAYRGAAGSNRVLDRMRQRSEASTTHFGLQELT